MELRSRAILSAKQVCLLAFFAHGPGCCGSVADLAFAPGKQSGHYQRHLDTVLKTDLDVSALYTLEVPSYNRYEGIRGTTPVYVYPPHEAFAAEVRANASLRDDLKKQGCAEVTAPELF